MENSENSRKNVNNKKKFQKIEITKFKININDVTKFFFYGQFPPFYKHKKGHQHKQNIFNFLKKFINL